MGVDKLTGLAALIQQRRTVHVFEDRPVSAALLKELLEVAVWAPNHRLTQPWRFVLLHGSGRNHLSPLEELAARSETDPGKRPEAAAKAREKILSVPAYLIVIMKENPHPITREEDYAATSCVIHNFSLLAWEQGLGMVWETYGLIYMEEVRRVLGVQPGERIVGSLHIGYPLKVPKARPRIKIGELLTEFG